MRSLSTFLSMILGLVFAAPLWAQTGTVTNDNEALGAVWASGFWFLITMVLLVCACVLAFQMATHPDRR